MPAINELKDELVDMTTLKFISSAFVEASSAKIKKIRASFEQNKQFFTEISHVYHLVRASAQKMKEKSAKEKKVPEAVSAPKVLAVALTSNQRFYGNININIMKTFIAQAEKHPTGLLIIGKTGSDLMRASFTKLNYDHIFFSKETPNEEEIRYFLDRIIHYDTVNIYYPKFVSLMTQTVGVLDITQAQTTETVETDEINILYEPELTKILEFFTRQVRSLLFIRVVLEADLSRAAARLMSMSQAEERSVKLIKEKKSQLRKVLSSLINRQLLETFAGMKKWKKH